MDVGLSFWRWLTGQKPLNSAANGGRKVNDDAMVIIDGSTVEIDIYPRAKAVIGQSYNH